MINEDFDADEILRDVDEKYVEFEEEKSEEEIRELNFGNIHDENKNFNDISNELSDWDE